MKSPHETMKHLINSIRLVFTTLCATLLYGPKEASAMHRRGRQQARCFLVLFGRREPTTAERNMLRQMYQMHRTFEEDHMRATTDDEVRDLFFEAMKHESSSESDPTIAHRDQEEINNGHGTPEALD